MEKARYEGERCVQHKQGQSLEAFEQRGKSYFKGELGGRAHNRENWGVGVETPQMKGAGTRIYINCIIRGAMSQIAYLQDFETPPAPRSRPLRLPLHLEHTLHLQDDPQKIELGECKRMCWPRDCRRATKSSILKFLDLKHRSHRKLSNHLE